MIGVSGRAFERVVHRFFNPEYNLICKLSVRPTGYQRSGLASASQTTILKDCGLPFGIRSAVDFAEVP